MITTKKGTDLLTIGEISRRSGVSISAIHFYESKTLIKSVRNRGNHRLFSRRELRILALIKVAQRLGFSLEEIQHAFKDLPHDKIPSKRDWQKITNAWMRTLQERIELAIKVRDQLTTCIGCGCLSLKDCPLRNPDDKTAELGPGAHLL